MRIRTQDDAESVVDAIMSRQGQTKPCFGSLLLPVAGGGYLEFGQNESRCGGGVGISVGCSWGMYGYAGGVLHREHIVELRDHLTKFLDGTLEIIRPEPTLPDIEQPTVIESSS